MKVSKTRRKTAESPYRLDQLNLAIVDVETTGAIQYDDRIIEVAVKRIERGRVVATYATLLDPERPVPPIIERLTGITNEAVLGAPTFASVRHELRQLLEGCIFVAHNVHFDYGFIQHAFGRLGEVFAAPCLCTVMLSRRLYPRYRRHGLSSLIQRFQLTCERRHRALDDAEAVWAFLQHAAETLRPPKLAITLGELLATPQPEDVVPPQLIKDLPEGPGAFVCYGADGQALYVGASCHVRRELAELWSRGGRSKVKQLLQQTAHISSQTTFGELGAQLLALRQMRELSPSYLHHRRVGEVRRRLWPYSGPILIEEHDICRSQGHVFIVDQWRLLLALSYGPDGPDLWPILDQPHDETASVLIAYLRKPKATIRRLTQRQAEQMLQSAQASVEDGLLQETYNTDW